MKDFNEMTSQEIMEYDGPIYSYSVIYTNEFGHVRSNDGDCTSAENREGCINAAVTWCSDRKYNHIHTNRYMRSK